MADAEVSKTSDFGRVSSSLTSGTSKVLQTVGAVGPGRFWFLDAIGQRAPRLPSRASSEGVHAMHTTSDSRKVTVDLCENSGILIQRFATAR